ncbi:MAG: hypothetical protein JOZ98_12145 [Solirubrobacterales bacterium]|nr:hypothetical protein [Solirubrobacterales bacterium]
MSEGRTAMNAGSRIGSGAARVLGAWRNLPHERRLAALAAIALFLTLFLPWYQETIIASGKATKLQSATASLTGWGAFSFVEGAILIVAIGVLALLFQRAEGRAFHVPGGDGGVILAAGAWTCVLVVWRMFDKQGTTGHGQYATTYGIEWGIFVALAVAAFLAYTGSRIRAARRPEPPLPGEADGPRGSRPAGSPPRDDPPPRRRPRAAPQRAPRPRRSELFEPVVPDDPPTMKLGRPSTPAGQRQPAPDSDESPTIPLESHKGDESAP